MLSPVMVHEGWLDVQVNPPGFAVATYLVGTPPDDGLIDTRMEPLPAEALTESGPLGTPRDSSGVAPAEAAEAGESPMSLRAMTLKV